MGVRSFALGIGLGLVAGVVAGFVGGALAYQRPVVRTDLAQVLPCPRGTRPASVDLEPNEVEPALHQVGCAKPNRHFQGPAFLWAGSQLVRVIPFDDGTRTGTAVAWNGEGKVWAISTFSHGKPAGTNILWNEKGQLSYTSRYTNNGTIEHGRLWYPNGTVRSRFTSVRDELEGEWRTWFPSGHLHLRGTYEHGKRQGRWICRKTPHAPFLSAVFDHGTFVSERSPGVTKKEFASCMNVPTLAGDSAAPAPRRNPRASQKASAEAND